MKWLEIVSESDIVDLNKRREQEQLKSFHRDLMSQIKSSASKMQDAYQEAKSKGWFDDLPVGTRFSLPIEQTQVSYIVIGHHMISSKTDQLQRHQLEFRHKHNFGPPAFIQSENKFYKPVILAKQVSGEEADATMTLDLDKLVNFETGKKRYTKFTGPTKVESQVRNKHKKIVKTCL